MVNDLGWEPISGIADFRHVLRLPSRRRRDNAFGRYRVWRIIHRLSYGVPRNQDAQRQSGLGNEPVSGGTGLHSSRRHFQRTGATRRPTSLVHHKDWQARAIEHFVSHPSEYPLVNLPEAKRAHDQRIRVDRFGLGQQLNGNMLVFPGGSLSNLRRYLMLVEKVKNFFAVLRCPWLADRNDRYAVGHFQLWKHMQDRLAGLRPRLPGNDHVLAERKR